MKRKLLSMLLTTAMVATLFTGCKKNTDEVTNDVSSTAPSGEAQPTEAQPDSAADEGKVFNVYCWNDDFQMDYFTKYYPDYVDNGDGTGTLGNITFKWTITPSEDNAYQNALDAALQAQADAAADDKIDLFLIEADYALKYVDTPLTMSLDEIGLSEQDMAGQYQYTKDIAKDDEGKLKATSWQATPGLFAYRRSIAKEVLGTDDPEKVQAKLSNWEDFDKVAEQAAKKGYKMLSGYDDSYRVFSNNSSGSWVQDNKIVIDKNILKWVDQTKAYTDKEYNNKTTLWASEWNADQGPSGKVFGFFYSTWGINFTLKGFSKEDPEGPDEKGNGIFGDYAVCEGPAPFYWGGTWMCGAAGSDNISLIKDIMETFTCNKDIMKKITEETQDYTNNQEAMNEIAGSDFHSDFLGGQNHIKLFAEAAPKIDMSNNTKYDQTCNEAIQTAFHDYFDGTVTKEEALENFYKAVVVKHPELTYDK
jgi:multiple sugar transport system substrate-binding protein